MHFLAFKFIALILVNVTLIASLTSTSLATTTTTPNFPIAKPNCTYQCGNVTIPFPFGLTRACSLGPEFVVACNHSSHPPKPVLTRTMTQVITHISLDGQLRIMSSIIRDCPDINGSASTTATARSNPTLRMNLSPFTVNNSANKIYVIGCDTYGFVTWDHGVQRHMGCCAMCKTEDELQQGSCKGSGCCEIPIPERVSTQLIELTSHGKYRDVWEMNDCGHAFVAEESGFAFSPEDFSRLKMVEEVPMVVDWGVGNVTCKEARRNSSAYACASVDSRCYEPSNGYGYRCACEEGYRGNPYLVDGCKDIDECQDPSLNTCEKHCVNKPGAFICVCPKGYRGDGKRNGQGCIRDESLVFKLVAGVALIIIALLVAGCWLPMELKRRNLIKMRQKYFLQNGGLLLEERLIRRDKSSVTARIFSESELQKATNNFHYTMIVGQGGYGTVYKGVLPDNEIVAIKKSIEVYPRQIEQFINEVIVLSQINHRNVVKLLGCCLETQAPLLVYEFIKNGTLSEHVHDNANTSSLSWDVRVRIAAETAGVLSYLHSMASTPIIHRDVKSSNILLDQNFTAKVSDFGASRLSPMDQTQTNTMVQGTFGYLDPEYMQTSNLTEKSDVYSFGVVLVELLTGRKAVSHDRPQDEQNLANFFLAMMKQDRLLQVVESNVLRDGNEEQVMKVAVIAENCLKLKGDERPFMKEVAMELEGLIVGDKCAFLRTEKCTGDDESLIRKKFEGFIGGDHGNCSSAGFDSLSHSLLATGAGR